METTPPTSPGFMDSLRVLGENLLASVQDRVELFSLELREEKLRQIRMLAWACAVGFATMMACTLASLTLAFLLWDSARLAVLGGMTLFYAGAAAGMGIAFRRFLARQPRPFNATLAELAQDRSCIREKI